MNNDKTWQRILEEIKEEISLANYRTWFSKTALLDLNPEKIIIATPSAFVKGQLQSRYDPIIKQASLKVTGVELTIEYTIDATLASKKTEVIDNEEDFFQVPQDHTAPTSILLNPKYSLESFVVGPTNNLAFAAAQAVSQNPGTSYNPLFIYGPSGVGKTHLMQAIGNTILTKNAYAKLVYASSERFTTDFVESLQTRRTGDFRQKYRQCDVLLIDDIQFIAGKDTTQEEFFHTFNELYSKNSQIVLTSDRPPNEMQKLESRLMSRFQGGLMVDIQLPDFETRTAILQAKLAERHESLPEECITYIAENVVSNTRELEGKLIQILQVMKLTNQSPTIESIERLLGKPQIVRAQKTDYKKILSEINQYFNVQMSDLVGPRRQKEFVLPRQIAMFLLYEDCKLPMEKIGQILGGRDHTTVLHGIEKIKDVVKRDRETQRMIVELRNQFA